MKLQGRYIIGIIVVLVIFSGLTSCNENRLPKHSVTRSYSQSDQYGTHTWHVGLLRGDYRLDYNGGNITSRGEFRWAKTKNFFKLTSQSVEVKLGTAPILLNPGNHYYAFEIPDSLLFILSNVRTGSDRLTTFATMHGYCGQFMPDVERIPNSETLLSAYYIGRFNAVPFVNSGIAPFLSTQAYNQVTIAQADFIGNRANVIREQFGIEDVAQPIDQTQAGTAGCDDGSSETQGRIQNIYDSGDQFQAVFGGGFLADLGTNGTQSQLLAFEQNTDVAGFENLEYTGLYMEKSGFYVPIEMKFQDPQGDYSDENRSAKTILNLETGVPVTFTSLAVAFTKGISLTDKPGIVQGEASHSDHPDTFAPFRGMVKRTGRGNIVLFITGVNAGDAEPYNLMLVSK
jgi:hypothetical protein